MRLAIALLVAGVPLAASADKVPGPNVGHPPRGTVSITMPGDLNFAFKPGLGAQAANTYCLTCHSSAYVSTQPPFDKAHWMAEVTKMRKAYGAQIPDAAAEQIAQYLAQEYGPK